MEPSSPARDSTPKLIVCVGASAGGLRALEVLFEHMPADTGCSFVVIQHLSPDFRSLMDDLLSRKTKIKIRHAEHDLPLEPDTIYLNPPKKILRLSGGRLQLAERQADRALEQPINVFFTSLAAEAGRRAVAVVLSGTGTDGADGVRAVDAAGGLTIAQDPSTAEFDGMPNSALETQCVDHTLAPQKIPAVIMAFAQNPTKHEGRDEDDPASSAEEDELSHEFSAMLRLLKQRYGLDFTQYKLATVLRRIRRRAMLTGLASPTEFRQALESNPAELDQLYCDLLIGVTEFFRDPAAFAALRRLVYEPLLRAKREGDFRVWIAGCATGEEAYTHAILLDEVAREQNFNGRIAIFATDAHRSSLEVAAAGCYSAERLSQIPEALRQRYFIPEPDGSFRILPDLRQRVVFAPHNLLSDPPFTKMDVVSCRNLLIYLTPAAQERAIAMLHYALRTGGAMMLGLSESIGRLASHFEVLDSKEKLYRKNPDSGFAVDIRPLVPGRSTPIPQIPARGLVTAPMVPRGLLHAYDQLLARALPPGFIINSEAEILHYIGDGARFLDPQRGRASENLLARTHGDLRLALSTLIPRALHSRSAEQSRSVRVDWPDRAPETIDLEVAPLHEDKSPAVLLHVALSASALPGSGSASAGPDQPTATEPFAPAAEQTRRIADLEQELISTRESLQATVEEIQTTNEELQATNEEMLAANEELQSTNEELHSVNEELYTVNAEFERKNAELAQTVADLDNLLAATDAGTLFLDRELRIRRFNPAIQSIFKLLPQDHGRSVEHIAYHLSSQTHLIEEARRVLQSGQPAEAEERTRDGHFLLRRIIPFFGPGRGIDGIVLTFTRIDFIKTMQTKLDLAMASARLVWWEWDLSEDRLVTHYNNWCILGYQAEALAPNSTTWFKLTHPDDLEQVRQTLEDSLSGRTAEWECEHRLLAHDQSWRWVLNKGRVTKRSADGRPVQMVGTTQDIHHRMAAELQLRQLNQAIEQADAAVIVTDATGAIEFVNTGFVRTTGFSAAEVRGQNPRILNSGHHPKEFFAQLWSTIRRGEVWRGEIVNQRRDGTLFTERVSITPLKDDHGRISHFIAVMEDITALKAADESRRRLENQLFQSQKMETLGTLAGGIAHDFNNLLTGILGYSSFARAEVPPGSDAQRHLDAVDRAARRATDLVQRILAFSRHHAPTEMPVVAGQNVRELALMLRPSLPTSIELTIDDQSDGASIIIDPVQFEQVVMNLCTNSAQAIGSRQGTLRIELALLKLQEPQSFDVGALTPGRYLRLTLTDNGPGIAPDILPRIFDPFFTTKDLGQGTGLGLSIVQNIVVSQGGAISVSSRRDVGTTFTLYFAVLGPAEPEPTQPPSPPAPEPPAEVPTMDLTSSIPLNGVPIFVVDDEEFVADLTAMTLEADGALVTKFYRPADCIAALIANPAAAQLIVSDQIMPGMTGVELTQKLRAAGNMVPVLLVSGFSRGANLPMLQELAPCRFLGKPFDRAKLLAELALLLAPENPPAP